MTTPTLRDVFDQHFNSLSEVAREVGVSPQAVQQWCAAGAVPFSSLLNVMNLLKRRDLIHEVPMQSITNIDVKLLKDLAAYV